MKRNIDQYTHHDCTQKIKRALSTYKKQLIVAQQIKKMIFFSFSVLYSLILRALPSSLTVFILLISLLQYTHSKKKKSNYLPSALYLLHYFIQFLQLFWVSKDNKHTFTTVVSLCFSFFVVIHFFAFSFNSCCISVLMKWGVFVFLFSVVKLFFWL